MRRNAISILALALAALWCHSVATGTTHASRLTPSIPVVLLQSGVDNTPAPGKEPPAPTSSKPREARAGRAADRRTGNAACDSINALIHVLSPVTPHQTGLLARAANHVCLLEFQNTDAQGRALGAMLREALRKRGWVEEKEKSADGPNGTRFGMRRGPLVLDVVGGWDDAPEGEEEQAVTSQWAVAMTDLSVQRRAAPAAAKVVEQSPGNVAVTKDPAFGEYVYVQELPEPLNKPSPDYPPAARAAGVEGTVIVQALVGRDGRVKDTRVVNSIPALDSAAVACVRQWTFKPAQAEGAPIAVWVAVPVRFTLGGATGAAAAPRPTTVMAPAPPPVPETLHVARDEEPLPLEAFTKRLAAARDSTWARAAATIAAEFAGGADCQCARFTVEVTSKPERFEDAMVVVTRDGLLDDSVGGDRYRLHLRRVEGAWRIESAFRSWRCGPGRGSEGYGIAPCK